jgi:choline dehydrogenase
MNFVWSPDNEWDYIANLTGDDSWGHEHMRRHLTNLENCTYVPEGTPGHGFEGYLVVRKLLSRPAIIIILISHL